jgi:nucleoside-diphosphate-sugar epimerase
MGERAVKGEKMKALVTGGAGFVGRHLIPKLEAFGYSVVSVDPKHYRYTDRSGSRTIPERFEMAEVQYLLHEYDFDLIVHLAAHIDDIDSRIRSNHRAYQDILLDYAMVEFIDRYASRHTKKPIVVWPTSCAVDYADDPYAWSKLTGERLFYTLAQRDFKVKILRPFSGYGGDQALTYPFPAILSRAQAKENPLTVWGSGMQVRDFIHVSDLTDAFVHAIDHFPDGVAVDICTGVGTDFLTLAKMIATEVGYEPEIKALREKAESSPKRVGNPATAEAYGFYARVGLRDGIRRALVEAAPAASPLRADAAWYGSRSR